MIDSVPSVMPSFRVDIKCPLFFSSECIVLILFSFGVAFVAIATSYSAIPVTFIDCRFNYIFQAYFCPFATFPRLPDPSVATGMLPLKRAHLNSMAFVDVNGNPKVEMWL